MYEARASGLGGRKIHQNSREFAEPQNRRTRFRVVGLLETTFSQFTIKLRDKIGVNFALIRVTEKVEKSEKHVHMA